ncbi:cytochrome c-type biogenesis protein CcmH [Lysobacter sp. K5869]|uniref:cytochrome c-type biogenesis protein n=1 Tax=Lysobacter sp. K5869 TaxID=2820808 RepID=UPI001C06098C|nr:cytochrome c-type biogenesis protein [Lysobacter sp. K5869]QWP75084.1 cytochrome c-type biogenesis protein CcmH [Lysobacter sp. K5869]
MSDSHRRAAARGRRRVVAALRNAAAAVALTFALCAPLSAQPANDPAPLRYNDPAEERRFHDLVAELRCVMCQNQSLADSNAQIAHDLRREVLDLMRQGKSDAQIKEFLVDRYGEFVLYRPRVESKTWLLWFGPVLVLLAGGFVVLRLARSRSHAAGPDDGTRTDLARNERSDEDQEW